MKKYSRLLLCFTLLFSLPGFGQYHWQYPIPQGNRLNDMLILPGSSTGYAVGNHGSILKTEDQGGSWMLMDSATTANLNGIAFTSQGKGYVVGDNGEILTTNTSGQWESMESGTHYHLNSVAFSTEDNGYAVGYKGLILRKQEDHWEEVNSPTLFTLYCIDFASITTAIAAGDSGTILRTSDGGTSWNKVSVPFNTAFNDVYFPSENIGFLTGQQGLILKTTDGGVSWADISYPQLDGNLLSIHFFNDTSGYACGANGVILSTINGGNNWVYYDKKTSLSFNEIIQLRPQIDTICDSILVCGDNGIILRSDSCSDQLTNVTHASHFTLSALKFPAENLGYVVGGDPFNDKPVFLKTSDGENWGTLAIDTIKRYLTDIDFINDKRGYISATKGVVYRFDGGENDKATPLVTGISDHLYAVAAIDSTKVWAAGLNGTIIRTISGDTTWQKLVTNTVKHLYDLFFFNANKGYAVGAQGIMLKITNGNQVSKILTGHQVPFYDIYFPTENKGFIVGYQGRILKVTITDGQESFTQIPSGVTTPLNDIYFPTPSVGYIAGEGGVILKSTDGGESWLPQHTSTQNGLRTMYFKDEAEGWIAGAGVSILKTENGGGAVITPGIAETTIEEYPINLYPNPATHETWIEFELEKKSKVRISTWDLAGRQLDFIADENQYTGTVRYHYNTAHLPKGIYLVIVEINQVKQAKKLVILR